MNECYTRSVSVHLVNCEVEVAECDPGHDGHPQLVRVAPPLVRQPGEQRVVGPADVGGFTCPACRSRGGA